MRLVYVHLSSSGDKHNDSLTRCESGLDSDSESTDLDGDHIKSNFGGQHDVLGGQLASGNAGGRGTRSSTPSSPTSGAVIPGSSSAVNNSVGGMFPFSSVDGKQDLSHSSLVMGSVNSLGLHSAAQLSMSGPPRSMALVSKWMVIRNNTYKNYITVINHL